MSKEKTESMAGAQRALEYLITGEASVFIGNAEFCKGCESSVIIVRPNGDANRYSYLEFLEQYKTHSFLCRPKPKNENLKPGKVEYVPLKNTGHESKITMTIESKNLREELRRLFE